MADLNFIVEINYGGNFVWNPNLKYVGGNITTIEDVYPNKPSFFFFLNYKICVRSLGYLVQVHIIT